MDEDKEFNLPDRQGVSDATPEQQQERPGGPENSHLPDMDFSSFVIFLATTAQMNLGSIPHPETGKTDVNTVAAKQMIDILGMLKDKTKGNLTGEEETLLDQVLFNLRMHYMRIAEDQ